MDQIAFVAFSQQRIAEFFSFALLAAFADGFPAFQADRLKSFVVNGRNFRKCGIDVVGRYLFKSQFGFDTYVSPELDAVFSAGKTACKSFLVQIVIGNKLYYNVCDKFFVVGEATQLLVHFEMASLLVGTVYFDFALNFLGRQIVK